MVRSLIDDYDDRQKKEKAKDKFKKLASKTVEASKQVGGKVSSKFGQIATNYYKNTKIPFPNQESPIWERTIFKPKILKANKFKVKKKNRR